MMMMMMMMMIRIARGEQNILGGSFERLFSRLKRLNFVGQYVNSIQFAKVPHASFVSRLFLVGKKSSGISPHKHFSSTSGNSLDSHNSLSSFEFERV